MKLTTYKRQLRESNLIRYKGKPPSIDLVNKCIAESKLTRQPFELIYGIVKKTLFWYIRGERGLPAIYWHIFYEFNDLEKFYSTFIVKQKRERKKKEQQVQPVISQTNKSLIDAYRAKFGQR